MESILQKHKKIVQNCQCGSNNILYKFYLFIYLIIFIVYFFEVLKNILTRTFRKIWWQILVTQQCMTKAFVTWQTIATGCRIPHKSLPPRYPALKMAIPKSSRSQMFFNIGVLQNFAKFTGKHLCWSIQQRCFPVNIAKFLKNSLLL